MTVIVTNDDNGCKRSEMIIMTGVFFCFILRIPALAFPCKALINVQTRNSTLLQNQHTGELISARAESTHKGVNKRSKVVTQAQQQRHESPTGTLSWHTCKNTTYVNSTRGTGIYVPCIFTHAR